MRSNRGESLFMTDQYARVAKPSSSLDKRLCAVSRHKPALTGGAACRYADAMARRDLIAEKLTKAFAPASLDVVDESQQHAGHAGHREGGETHFRVYIVAEAFFGKSRLERHRMINEMLVGELEGGVHALLSGHMPPTILRKTGTGYSAQSILSTGLLASIFTTRTRKEASR